MEIKETLLKPYTENQRIDFIINNNHSLGYEIIETEEELQAWGYDDTELLNEAKLSKISLNDELRDTALFGGVTYNNVLFDSDTDQKVNISETVRDMSDEDTIVWYGMDNQGLLCTKADLIAIGEEIRNLTKYCWGMNAYIKEQIEQAETLEELEEIEINYENSRDI